jgi:hypothetical protein
LTYYYLMLETPPIAGVCADSIVTDMRLHSSMLVRRAASGDRPAAGDRPAKPSPLRTAVERQAAEDAGGAPGRRGQAVKRHAAEDRAPGR